MADRTLILLGVRFDTLTSVRRAFVFALLHEITDASGDSPTRRDVQAIVLASYRARLLQAVQELLKNASTLTKRQLVKSFSDHQEMPALRTRRTSGVDKRRCEGW
jgi:hypothetical protein